MSTTTTTPTRTASESRFYQLEMRNRPVLNGDIGSLIRIDGLIVGGGGESTILLLPSAGEEVEAKHLCGSLGLVRLSAEEWSEFLLRSDVPEVLVGPAKAFHRKSRYEISGLVQQKVWVADGFKCMYCGRKMGDVQLTIDHWQPLELGGANDTSNYLSCCRKDNKQKGSQAPQDWCVEHGLDYGSMLRYMANRKV